LFSSPKILSSTCSSLLQWLLTICFSWFKEFLFPGVLFDFFSWDFPYLIILLFHILCCLLYVHIPLISVSFVSFWSLLKSSLSSFNCFFVFLSF
jgi:hypothetical protein